MAVPGAGDEGVGRRFHRDAAGADAGERAKIIIHPALVFVFTGMTTLTPGWGDIALLAAAGPSGAMPFVIALEYGIRTETIAKVVLVSTLFSLLTLSVLAS